MCSLLALSRRQQGLISCRVPFAARAKFGEEQVHIWRRSFDVPPPGGESLKLTADRALPYFKSEILPRVQKGEKVLVAAHGNSLRAIIMALEELTGEQILQVELATGVPIVYKLSPEGKVVSKEILSESSNRRIAQGQYLTRFSAFLFL